jgi:hypothetical protein
LYPVSIFCRGFAKSPNFLKNSGIFGRKAEAQYPFEAKARVTNWRRLKAEGDEGEREGESILKRLGRYYYEERSVPT